MLLLAAGLGMSAAGLVLCIAWMGQLRVQAQRACDAVALAGAAHLMDRAPLYGWCEGTNVPDVGTRLEMARRAARQFAERNAVGGARMVLAERGPRAHGRNGPSCRAGGAKACVGQLRFGWIENGGRLHAPTACEEPRRMNALRVEAACPHDLGCALTAWLGRQTGWCPSSLTTSATAMVDQHVVGFRPAGHVRVPVIPLAVSIEDGNPWSPVGRRRGGAALTDHFSHDARTKEVHGVPDGIREMVLLMRRPGPTGEEETCEDMVRQIALGAETLDGVEFRDRVHHGLDAEDLAGLGGGFMRGHAVPSPGPRDSLPLVWIQEALLQRRGRPFVWPLAVAASAAATNSGQADLQIVDFAAGAVVDCYFVSGSDSCLAIVVQPCLVQTATAVLRSDGELNPWIGKLVLTR